MKHTTFPVISTAVAAWYAAARGFVQIASRTSAPEYVATTKFAKRRMMETDAFAFMGSIFWASRSKARSRHTLCHEYAHVMQGRREGELWSIVSYLWQNFCHGYEANRYEIEADLFAAVAMDTSLEEAAEMMFSVEHRSQVPQLKEIVEAAALDYRTAP